MEYTDNDENKLIFKNLCEKIQEQKFLICFLNRKVYLIKNN